MLSESSHILKEDKVIWIDIPHGDIVIHFGDFDAVTISGSINERYLKDWYILDSEDGLAILLDIPTQNLFTHSQTTLDIVINVPEKHAVKVDTFNATIKVLGLGGELDLTSMAGDVLIEYFTGHTVIKANRGDVTVKETQGSTAIFSNYGLINLVNVRGNITAVNILGKIHFNGTPSAEDQIRLETDHGSVDFALTGDVDLTYQLKSTNGEVTCLLPDANRAVRQCHGKIGSGSGQLYIKTVSGGIKLHLFPYHSW